jgi:hypothetical protein
MHMHHIGSNKENPVAVLEGQEEQLEVPEQEVPKAAERDIEELQECPNHRPSSFERGKPQSIFPRFANIDLCFTLIDALCSGVVCNYCCIIPSLPLLCSTLATLVFTVKLMLS